MSLCDGYKANHGENGLLGVTKEGYGVYYREETSKYNERVVLLDVSGTTIDEKELSDGMSEAISYVNESYEWEEYTPRAERFLEKQNTTDA